MKAGLWSEVRRRIPSQKTPSILPPISSAFVTFPRIQRKRLDESHPVSKVTGTKIFTTLFVRSLDFTARST